VDLTEKQLKKLATELEADAIVSGKLDKVSGTRTLKIRLFVHNKMANGPTVSVRNASSPKFKTTLHDKLVDKIGTTEDDDDDRLPAKGNATNGKRKSKGKRAKGATADELSVARNGKPDDDAKSNETAKKADDEAKEKAKRAAEAYDADKKADDDDNEKTPKNKRTAARSDDDSDTTVTKRVKDPNNVTHAANRVAARLDIGVSVVQRSFDFDAQPFPKAPKNTALSPVPGARFDAELYPLAFQTAKTALAGLGAAFEYDQVLPLNLAARTMDGATTSAKTTESHYSLGLRYRILFGSTEMSSSITLGVDYAKRLFSADRSQVIDPMVNLAILRDTPNSEYTIYEPNLAARIPITKLTAIVLAAGGMIVADSGPIARPTSYGAATAYGGRAMAGVDIVLGNQFALRFTGELVQVGLSFNGIGEYSSNLDGNKSTREVSGLTDRSIGGIATLAFMY
jgi:hypothetical protein